MSTPTIHSLHRYPVKSLGGEALTTAEFRPGRGLAFDRRWGLAVAGLGPLLDGSAAWRPWNFCLSLKRTEALAELRATVTEEDAAAPVLEIAAAAGGRARGRPGAAAERATLENFLRRELADARIVLAESEAAPLWDESGVSVSVLNLASAAALSERMGLRGEQTLAAARFRANLVLAGAAPWAETEWTGKEFAPGDAGAVFRITAMTPRCAATRVNPATAARDANVPAALVAHFGHSDLGIYAEPIRPGAVRPGDAWTEK